ncbi:MAG: aminoglycoside phosphotransferase family protein [Mucilaginibacter polytrichastri]|nr:aminoglycoside phosphotransferase family protein [Mucilaginibacter polytrichastri]
MPESTVLNAFDLSPEHTTVHPIGNGLIHKTWHVKTAAGSEYILQQMNTAVFKRPDHIAENMRMIGDYLQIHHPEYLFIRLLNDRIYQTTDGRVYRMYSFVRNSHTVDTPVNATQVFEAAKQFGEFTRVLSGLDAQRLHITLPGFHDLGLRYRQFRDALKNGNATRLLDASHEVNALISGLNIVEEYGAIIADPEFRLRITHHDTKINNVLFDRNDKGICVIDLDTVMPGYFISDVGDMMRTYLSPLNEESLDFNDISITDEYLQAITEGYLSEMNGELTEKEKQAFYFSGRFMIYMQALRFMTDHLNDDAYYGARYEGHNLNRARNQLTLLKRYDEKTGVKKA